MNTYTKIAVVLLLAVLFGTQANAQLSRTDSFKTALYTKNRDTVAWLREGNLIIGLNQGFLHNWAAGGELASLTVNGVFSGHLDRVYHRHVWSNNLDMNYALLYAYSNFFVPRKVNDRIDFTSKYGVRIDTAKNFFLTALFNFKSQFTKGYDYSVPQWDTFSTSRFLSPAYFILAAGMEYRRGTVLSLFLSPAAARITTADRYYTLRNPEGAFGIPYGKTTRFELGAYFSGRHQWDINERTYLKSRLDLYANYLAKDRTDSLGNIVMRDNPGNIDILIDVQYAWKMSRYMALSIGATAIYDNDLPYEKTYIDENGQTVQKSEPGQGLGWWQLRQLFTLAFQYRF